MSAPVCAWCGSSSVDCQLSMRGCCPDCSDSSHTQRCDRCGREAEGFAMVGGKRLCHPDYGSGCHTGAVLTVGELVAMPPSHRPAMAWVLTPGADPEVL